MKEFKSIQMNEFKSENGKVAIRTSIKNAEKTDRENCAAIMIRIYAYNMNAYNMTEIELIANEKYIHIWKEEFSDATYSHITELKITTIDSQLVQSFIFDDLQINYSKENDILVVRVKEI